MESEVAAWEGVGKGDGEEEGEDEGDEEEDVEEDGWAAVSWGWYAPRTSLMPMP